MQAASADSVASAGSTRAAETPAQGALALGPSGAKWPLLPAPPAGLAVLPPSLSRVKGADIVGIDICAVVDRRSGATPATPEDLEETGRQISAAGRRWLGLKVDQWDLPALRAAAARAEQEFGGVDILFANAGIQSFHPLLEMEDADWSITIDTNLTGSANAVRAFAPHIVKRGGGGGCAGFRAPASRGRGQSRRPPGCEAIPPAPLARLRSTRRRDRRRRIARLRRETRTRPAATARSRPCRRSCASPCRQETPRGGGRAGSRR